ncbi:MAG TPA: hypothetical protein V6D28_08035 [Leptolyngbyaceae cyanobacterium]
MKYQKLTYFIRLPIPLPLYLPISLSPAHHVSWETGKRSTRAIPISDKIKKCLESSLPKQEVLAIEVRNSYEPTGNF